MTTRLQTVSAHQHQQQRQLSSGGFEDRKKNQGGAELDSPTINTSSDYRPHQYKIVADDGADSSYIWKILLVFITIIAIVALILGAYATAKFSSSDMNNARTLQPFQYTSINAISIGNATSGSELILLSAGSKSYTPVYSDSDGGAFIVTASGTLQNLYVSLSAVQLKTAETTPTVTVTIARASSGEASFTETALVAQQIVDDSADFFPFFNKTDKVTVSAGDRLVVLVSAGSASDDTVTANISASFENAVSIAS